MQPQCGSGRDGAEVAQHVLGVRARAARRGVRARARARRARGRGRGSAARLEPLGERVVEQAAQRRPGDRPAAQAGDDVVHLRPASPDSASARRSGRRCRRRRPRRPSPARRRASRRPSAARTSSSGQGRKQRDRRARRSRTPVVAQLVDDVLDGAEHRAERDDDGLGVLERGSGARSPPDARPNAASNSVGDRAGSRRAPASAWRASRYRTSVNASGPTIAPIVTGSSGSSTCRGSNGGRKASTCSCVGQVDLLERRG